MVYDAKTVKLRDVAEKAGVSVITASRALRSEAYVRAETRASVLAAAAQLGYHPNTLARQFRSNASHTIGFVMPDISNPFFATIARGMAGVLRREGYDLIVYDTESQPDLEEKAVHMLMEHRVDGLVISSISRCTDELLAILNDVADRIVVMDNRIVGLHADGVFGDDVEGGKRVTEHLLGIGYRSIAMITGPLTETSASDRLQGYAQALTEAGVYAPHLIRYGDFQRESGKMLAQELIALPERPQAIICANNFMAVGALTALREAELRIPQDIALVSYDDVDLTDLIDPPLTIMAQPAAEMGQQAAHLILTRLAKQYQGQPRTILLQPSLVIRMSCGGRIKIQKGC